jgi:hypothetical protein
MPTAVDRLVGAYVRGCRHISKVGLPFRITRIRKEWAAHGGTTIQTISKQPTGGVMKKKDQPAWMIDG